MSSLGKDDKKSTVLDTENNSEMLFHSSNIKKVDHSKLFTKIEGNKARERAAKREQDIHDRNLEKRRKKFQADLKKQEQQTIRRLKKDERREWRIRNKKKIVMFSSLAGVLVFSVVGGLIINRVLNPPLTEREQEIVNHGVEKQRVTQNIQEAVFLKYDRNSTDPEHLPSIYAMAEEYINNLNEEDKFGAYASYATFAKGRADLVKMKEIIDIMEGLAKSDLEKHDYYNFLALYYRSMGDSEKANEYQAEAKKYKPEETEW